MKSLVDLKEAKDSRFWQINGNGYLTGEKRKVILTLTLSVKRSTRPVDLFNPKERGEIGED